MSRVLVADDHAAFRTVLRLSLEALGWQVVGEASDGAAAVEVACRVRPDLCVLDVHMPGGGGLLALEEITRRLPDIPCVMLTASEDHADLVRALRGGAAGYLPKHIDPDRLDAALRGVLRGEAALPRVLVRQVLELLVRAVPRAEA